MFRFSDLPELVGDYASGDVDWPIAYPVLLRLLGDHEVAEVMAALSPELASRFSESLHDEFRSEEFATSGLWIDNAGGEPPNREQIVVRIQRWFSENPRET